jgi:DNA-binding XRE family transcriptional regulator
MFLGMLTLVCGQKCIPKLEGTFLQRINMAQKQRALIQFGEKVKLTRKEKGLSQEELASIANLHRTYIGMIERAEKNITLISMLKISKALDVTICELLEFVNNGEQT